MALAWAWFFLALLSYYALKPLRDALATDSQSLSALYVATFIATCVALPAYSWLVSRVARPMLVVAMHQVFVACLLAFWGLLAAPGGPPVWLPAVFFVWVSVFNLYVVALFWSVMADVFSPDEGSAWFGTMAAAGSLGALAASGLAVGVVERLGSAALPVVSVAALELATVVALVMLRGRRGEAAPPAPDGAPGGYWDGVTRVFRSRYLLAICLFVVVGKFAATFLYNGLQHALRGADLPLDDRTALFSRISLYSQSGSFVVQALVAGLLMRRLGLAATLGGACAVLAGLFAWLATDASLAALAVGQAVQQVVAYGLLAPGQHALFSVVPREDKYKAKAFIDTVVFRGSDVLAARASDALLKTPLGYAAAALAPVLVLWALLGVAIGRVRDRRAGAGPAPPEA